MGLFVCHSRAIKDSTFTSGFRSVSTAILLLVMLQAENASTILSPRVQRLPMDASATVTPDLVEKSLTDEAAYE
jgi:hypothetical protein